MPYQWNKLDRGQKPVMEQVSDYVDNPLWEALCRHVEEEYQSKPLFEYSGCIPTGWNVKYKKSGRSLCTLYPMEGCFIALVVIGPHEKGAFDLALPLLSSYTQELYESKKDKNGLCWLMFEVRESGVLPDVKTCIEIRRGYKKQNEK